MTDGDIEVFGDGFDEYVCEVINRMQREGELFSPQVGWVQRI